VKGKIVDLRAAKVLETQFALLKKGCRATFYACRELLDLPVDWKLEDVAKSLHQRFHRLKDIDESLHLSLVTAWCTAASQLLKAVNEK